MIEIGLVNNMAGVAHKVAARQFGDLLEAAAGPIPIRLRSFSPLAQTTPASNPSPSEASCDSTKTIFESGIDALIVTGMEPAARDLRDEPCWGGLVELLDWAEENSVPVILSCLAAHAAVLHRDGIARRPLAEKCFGVFEETLRLSHPLTRDITGTIRVPHSRWNELPRADLVDAGYEILTDSPGAGVDIFTRGRNCRSVFFQGHPEYDPERLLLEYRRDVRRFLTGERQTYPRLPLGYFEPQVEAALTRFQALAMESDGDRSALEFPDDIRVPSVAAWRLPAETFFRNWVAYLHEYER